jgi:hypothetical protein
MESGHTYSMAEVLEGVESLCKSKISAEEDTQDRETLAAEAEEVMKQMRDQLGLVVASSEIPEEKQADESGGKAEEVLKNLKAGANAGFPRKGTQGKNHMYLFAQGVGIEKPSGLTFKCISTAMWCDFQGLGPAHCCAVSPSCSWICHMVLHFGLPQLMQHILATKCSMGKHHATRYPGQHVQQGHQE